MDIWKAVEILDANYRANGRDPLEECRRVKEEISKEIASLSFEDLTRYFDGRGFDEYDDAELELAAR